MQRLRTTLRILVVLIVGLFLHYVLPQHDVVKIGSTEVIRADFSSFNRLFYAQADSGTVEQANRDLRLINTDKKRTFLLGFVPRDQTEVMVYRNEDTGWIWPPYFKFDSSDLQAEAANVARSDGWVVITHYGWRIKWLTVFPNAIAVRPLEDENATIIPWFNIAFFIFLAFCFGMVRAMWRQFRERSVNPLLDSAGDQYDELHAGVSERRSRVGRWMDTWRKKDNRKH